MMFTHPLETKRQSSVFKLLNQDKRTSVWHFGSSTLQAPPQTSQATWQHNSEPETFFIHLSNHLKKKEKSKQAFEKERQHFN